MCTTRFELARALSPDDLKSYSLTIRTRTLFMNFNKTNMHKGQNSFDLRSFSLSETTSKQKNKSMEIYVKDNHIDPYLFSLSV